MADFDHTPSNEIWKPVVGYEGIYEVSSLGSVRSLDGPCALKPEDPRKARARRGRVLKQYTQPIGRKMVTLHCARGKKTFLVHRLVTLAFHGPSPDPTWGVAHRNGNMGDNRAENLRWLSQLENNREQVLHGTRMCGEKAWKAVLDEHKVRRIRALSAEGVSHKNIAPLIGISSSVVCRVVNRKAWSHVA